MEAGLSAADTLRGKYAFFADFFCYNSFVNQLGGIDRSGCAPSFSSHESGN